MDSELEVQEYLFNIYIDPWIKNFKGEYIQMIYSWCINSVG